MTARQLDLFDSGTVELDRSFAPARRIQLDEHSWIEHVPAWLTGADRVFALLLGQAGWEQRDRWMINRMVTEPRLTAQYPDVRHAPELLRSMAGALSTHYDIPYDGLWINLYRDQHDSTGWHGDGPSCKRDVCTVPVLTLGATRRFLIRTRNGGPSTAISPRSGDLVVMGGRCQRDWRHCVPKQVTPAGPRMSVNFTSTLQATPLRQPI